MAVSASLVVPDGRKLHMVMDGDSPLALWILQMIEEGFSDKLPMALQVRKISTDHPLSDLLSRLHAL